MEYNKEKIEIQGNFGERLAGLLANRNVTKSDMSRGTGISLSLISRYCKGERLIHAENLRKMADYLYTSAEYLAGAEEETANERKTQSHALISWLMHGLGEDDQQKILDLAEIFAKAGGTWDASDSVAQRICSLVEEKGWSQVDFAEQMGTTQQVVCSIMSGAKQPSRAQLAKMCEIFGVKPQIITGDTEEVVAMTPTQLAAEKIVGKLTLKSQQILYEVCLRYVRAVNPEYLA